MPTTDKPLSIYTDLIAAQQAFPSIRKDNTADTGKFKYKYADLGDILDAVKPVLHANNFALVQATAVAQTGDMTVETRLYHVSGEHISSSYPVRCAEPNDPQKIGGALTYARRYALMAMLGLAAEDDDGQHAGMSSQRATSRPQPRQHEATKPDVAPAESMPDDIFGPEVRQAITAHDDAALLGLLRHAHDHIGRWIQILKGISKPESIVEIERQMATQGVSSPVLLQEIVKQRTKLGIAPSPAVRQARRENALPGGLIPEDEIERGIRKAAELTLS